MGWVVVGVVEPVVVLVDGTVGEVDVVSGAIVVVVVLMLNECCRARDRCHHPVQEFGLKLSSPEYEVSTL